MRINAGYDLSDSIHTYVGEPKEKSTDIQVTSCTMQEVGPSMNKYCNY